MMRPIKVEFGSQVGTVTVQLGRTRACASITADLVKPFPDRPTEGFLNFFADFSPMASPFFEPGRPSDKSVELSRVVERGIRDSKAIDNEALCVLAGEKVWSIRCDVHILDYEGNVTDCANLAAVVALLHFRRPDVTVVGNKVTIHGTDDAQPVALPMHHIPISLTFALFDYQGKEKFVLDPNRTEEAVSKGSLVITMNEMGEICCVQKAGLAVPYDMILQCSTVAFKECQRITTSIKEKLKDDHEKNRTAIRIARASQKSKFARPIDAFGVNVTKSCTDRERS